MRKKVESEIREEEEKLKKDIQRIHDSYEKTDREFQKWKEEVLQFEHSKHRAAGDSDDDHRVQHWERVWTAEDEDDSE
jgi:hypothetical protein